MKLITPILVILMFVVAGFAQSKKPTAPEIVEKAVSALGGDAYLRASTLSSKGNLSLTQGNRIVSFQTFVDIMVYPDKERTDFKGGGLRTVQVNMGDSGWLYDERFEKFVQQNETQINNFKRSLRTHYDYLLKGKWKGNAELSYVGRKPAGIGVRNDVLKLEFEDGFVVEYEFSAKGLPQKVSYTRQSRDGVTLEEEYRYGRFISTDGIMFPHMLDQYRNGKQNYRVIYEAVYFNRRVDPKIFVQPATPKKLKKLKVK